MIGVYSLIYPLNSSLSNCLKNTLTTAMTLTDLKLSYVLAAYRLTPPRPFTSRFFGYVGNIT